MIQWGARLIKMRKSKRRGKSLQEQMITIAILIILAIAGYVYQNMVQPSQPKQVAQVQNSTAVTVENLPTYDGRQLSIPLQDNQPNFTDEDKQLGAFETYSPLDSLGRCGVAYANICQETMPKSGEKRGDISSIRPSGWKQAKYDGEFLYNRCHLIGYQLAAENANEKNLITGTRYFNVEGMLPYENQVAEYIQKNPSHHVLYRVTPIFEEDDLVAKGVEMEAYSQEDQGAGVCFHVFVYNVQPGITIDYHTRKSEAQK